MVYASESSPYIKLLAPFLAKKKRLAADEWGTDTKHVQHIFQPLEDMLVEEVPSIKSRYPKMWSVSTHVGRLVRNILLSEELYPEVGGLAPPTLVFHPSPDSFFTSPFILVRRLLQGPHVRADRRPHRLVQV